VVRLGTSQMSLQERLEESVAFIKTKYTGPDPKIG
jgi:hypothetical protein